MLSYHISKNTKEVFSWRNKTTWSFHFKLRECFAFEKVAFFWFFWWDHLPWQHHQFSIYYERKCWRIRRQDHLTIEKGKNLKKWKIFSSKIFHQDCFRVCILFLFISFSSRIFVRLTQSTTEFYCRFTVNVIHCSFVVSSETHFIGFIMLREYRKS